MQDGPTIKELETLFANTSKTLNDLQRDVEEAQRIVKSIRDIAEQALKLARRLDAESEVQKPNE